MWLPYICYMVHRGTVFKKLCSYYHFLEETNLGTITHIEVDSLNRFHYFFLIFGASTRGYMLNLRPVICANNCHLKGPNKVALLLATV